MRFKPILVERDRAVRATSPRSPLPQAGTPPANPGPSSLANHGSPGALQHAGSLRLSSPVKPGTVDSSTPGSGSPSKHRGSSPMQKGILSPLKQVASPPPKAAASHLKSGVADTTALGRSFADKQVQVGGGSTNAVSAPGDGAVSTREKTDGAAVISPRGASTQKAQPHAKRGFDPPARQAPQPKRVSPKSANKQTGSIASSDMDTYDKLFTSGGGVHTVVTNNVHISPPQEPTLMDNTQLFLPRSAVLELGLEPNMDDKGDDRKTLWFGRVWELRALVEHRYAEKFAKRKQESLTPKQKADLSKICADPRSRALLTKMAARWKGASYRARVSLSLLEKIKYCNLRGTLVYAHGSGGNSWDNMRICRMICKHGVLVIVPDGFAYPKDTPMGKLRHKDLLPLHKATDDIDYWAGDLMYCSDSAGELTYSTKAEGVLSEPDKFRELYEKCYQMRRNELHFIIDRLPQFIKVQGIFLGGTSEGAMTIARFDDERYGTMILGRFINSFSIEYCYFTPTPEAGKIGGQLDVPTLNIIGTKDQFFGPQDSVAKLVVSDEVTGFGDKQLDGNGYPCLVEQKVEVGLVCIFEDGVHSPCDTHDNFLRPLFDMFFRRPGDIWQLEQIWERDPMLKELCSVTQRHVAPGSRVVQVFCPRMKFPQKMDFQVMEQMHFAKGFDKKIKQMLEEETNQVEAERRRVSSMLDHFRKGSHS